MMKITKKILSLLIAGTLLLGTSTAGSVIAVADPEFSVTSAQGQIGEDIAVNINISNNPGIISLRLNIQYDSSVLELKEATPKNYASTSFGPLGNNPFVLSWEDAIHDNTTTNGTIAQLVFTIKEDATVGNTSISITYDPEDVFNQDFHNVHFETIAGVVAVSCSKHQYGELISEVPVQCGVDGRKAYYECSVCHKLFDESKTETTAEQLVIPALQHTAEEGWHSDENNHWKVCENAGCDHVMENTTDAHIFEWVVDTAATEDVPGVQHEECKVCGYVRSENTEIPQLPHVHTGITHHEAVAANCHETGTVEYWTCSSDKCKGKYYSDSDCTTEIQSVTTPIDKNIHDGGTEVRDAVAATCSNDGYTGDTYCLGCGEKIAEGKTVPATGEHVNAAGKWESDGANHWQVCDNCDAEFNKAVHEGGEATCSAKAVCVVCSAGYGELEPDNHVNTEIRDAVAATEEAEGYTGDKWCLDCNKMIEEGTVIAKLDHTHAMVKTEAKPATCEEDGNIEYYTCSKCGKRYNDEAGTRELSDEEVIIEAAGHSYGSEWKSDADGHWHECTCGERSDERVHTFGDWTVIKEATKAEGGSKERECTVCGYIQTEAIPAEPGITSPEEPDDSSQNPQTGDRDFMLLWIGVCVLSSGVIVVVYATRKRVKR